MLLEHRCPVATLSIRQVHDRILGNECTAWRKDGTGPHARAYTLLTSERSRRMAKVLGAEAAEARADCLACHALNVEREKRDPRFQLSYGVTCEACHGRSGAWRDVHAGKDAWRKLSTSQKAQLGYADLKADADGVIVCMSTRGLPCSEGGCVCIVPPIADMSCPACGSDGGGAGACGIV